MQARRVYYIYNIVIESLSARGLLYIKEGLALGAYT